MASAAVAPLSTREASRARAIRRFRWSILGPLIALFALVLLPVLFLQLYFSFHQWSVYLGSWWEADYVGLELFREVLTDQRFGWAIVRRTGRAKLKEELASYKAVMPKKDNPVL